MQSSGRHSSRASLSLTAGALCFPSALTNIRRGATHCGAGVSGVRGSVGNFLEWFDFALYGLFANEIAAVTKSPPHTSHKCMC